MSWFRGLFVLGGTWLALAGASFGAPAADAQLDAVLARMDQASTTFKGLAADIRKVSHTEVVNIDDGGLGHDPGKAPETARYADPHRSDESTP